MKIAVLVSGKGSNLRAIHEAIESGVVTNAAIACVISDKENAGGLEYAADNGIKAYFVNPKDHPSREVYDSAVAEIINAEGVELICLAGFMRILSSKFIHSFAGRIMNIHPSLLPAFPGLNAVRQALDYGVRLTGCTVHFVDEGLDSGPVIVQEAVPVMQDDTAESLTARIQKSEHKIYPLAVQLFANSMIDIDGRKVKIKG